MYVLGLDAGYCVFASRVDRCLRSDWGRGTLPTFLWAMEVRWKILNESEEWSTFINITSLCQDQEPMENSSCAEHEVNVCIHAWNLLPTHMPAALCNPRNFLRPFAIHIAIASNFDTGGRKYEGRRKLRLSSRNAEPANNWLSNQCLSKMGVKNVSSVKWLGI